MNKLQFNFYCESVKASTSESVSDDFWQVVEKEKFDLEL